MARLELREFDWAGLVQKGLFENMAFGIVGAGIGLVILQAPATAVAPWLVVNVLLSCVCLFVAYLRIWKTAREEHETADLWMAVHHVADPNEGLVNRVFEFPYLFSIGILPFTAAAPQFFMGALLVFYLTDNYYNSALMRGVGALAPNQPPAPAAADRGVVVWIAARRPGIRRRWAYLGALLTGLRRTFWVTSDERRRLPKRDQFVAYFETRFRYNRLLGFSLLAAIVISVLQKLGAVVLPIDADGLILIVILVVGVTELIVEPMRNLGMPFAAAGATANAIEDAGESQQA